MYVTGGLKTSVPRLHHAQKPNTIFEDLDHRIQPGLVSTVKLEQEGRNMKTAALIQDRSPTKLLFSASKLLPYIRCCWSMQERWRNSDPQILIMHGDTDWEHIVNEYGNTPTRKISAFSPNP